MKEHTAVTMDMEATSNGYGLSQEQTNIELDAITEAFIREVRTESERKQREAMAEVSLPFVNQEQAALQLFIRREHLEGSWRLQADGKTLKKEG